MNSPSRRGFLAVAGVGAAGVAAATVIGSGSSASASPAPDITLPEGASGSIVAYITDVQNGHMSVMVGERAVVIHDRELVARLAHAVAE
jgi:hypothetical protein